MAVTAVTVYARVISHYETEMSEDPSDQWKDGLHSIVSADRRTHPRGITHFATVLCLHLGTGGNRVPNLRRLDAKQVFGHVRGFESKQDDRMSKAEIVWL